MGYEPDDLQSTEPNPALDVELEGLHARDRAQHRQDALRTLRDALIAAGPSSSAPRDAAVLAAQLRATPVELWPEGAADFARAVVDPTEAPANTSAITVRAVWRERGEIHVATTWDRELANRLRAVPGGQFSGAKKVWKFSGTDSHPALRALLAEFDGFRVSQAANRVLHENESGGIVDLIGAGTLWRVSLRYSPEAVTAVRSLPAASFDEETTAWSVPVSPDSTRELLSIVDRFGLAVTTDAQAGLARCLSPGVQRHLRAAETAVIRAVEQLDAASRLGASSNLLGPSRTSVADARATLANLTAGDTEVAR